MAKLTTLSKVLIGVAVVSVACAGSYGLARMGGLLDGADGDGDGNGGIGSGLAGLVGGGATGPLGSESNPLKVSIVSFHGYAPALVANGNSLTTKPGSIYANEGVNVEFVIQDDIPTLPTIFESGAAHCAWRTSDFWAQEHPSLRGNELDARAVMVVDNTRGGDAIIAKDPSIQSVEDLPGHSVALLQFTPSDGLFIDAVANSSLSGRKKQAIETVYINPDEGTAGVRAAFESGQADAAVLWDPDLSLALRAPGAHVVYSTATATNLIYDVMVCDTRYLDDPQHEEVFQDFVTGWMKGVEVAEADPDKAVEALKNTEEFFALLAKEEGDDFVKGLFKNVKWTGLEENARILGRAGGMNHFERVYREFDRIYRAAGYIADPNAPVINPSDAFDYRFIDKLLAADAAAKEAAAKPEFTFTEAERDKVAGNKADVTKAVQVNFSTGSAELTKRAQQTIDNEMIPLIDSMGNAYFEVSGNTDSTGSAGANKALSQKRAQAVTDYLVKEWEVDASRLIVVGKGEDDPICDEQNPESEGTDLEGCRAMNRTTRVAVLAR